jgi:hypothetical protein
MEKGLGGRGSVFLCSLWIWGVWWRCRGRIGAGVVGFMDMDVDLGESGCGCAQPAAMKTSASPASLPRHGATPVVRRPHSHLGPARRRDQVLGGHSMISMVRQPLTLFSSVKGMSANALRWQPLNIARNA